MHLRVHILALVALVFLIVCRSGQAKPIILLRDGTLVGQVGILSPALDFEKTGMQVLGRIGDARDGGSLIGASASFPFQNHPQDARNSGWAWGFAAGLTKLSYVTGEALAPSFYYWELMLGRGTVALPFDSDTGLHGYMEFVIRDQRPQNSLNQTNDLMSLGAHIDDHHISWGVRMGVATLPSGTGLVEQRASPIGYAVEGAAYFPLSQQSTALSLRTDAFKSCGWSFLSCGIRAQFIYFPDSRAEGSTIELKRALSGGPSVRGDFNNRVAFETLLMWGVLSSDGAGSPGGPSSLASFSSTAVPAVVMNLKIAL